jgi:hypothetical protein
MFSFSYRRRCLNTYPVTVTVIVSVHLSMHVQWPLPYTDIFMHFSMRIQWASSLPCPLCTPFCTDSEPRKLCHGKTLVTCHGHDHGHGIYYLVTVTAMPYRDRDHDRNHHVTFRWLFWWTFPCHAGPFVGLWYQCPLLGLRWDAGWKRVWDWLSAFKVSTEGSSVPLIPVPSAGSALGCWVTDGWNWLFILLRC